jgi:hypothetical protein
MVKNKAYPVEIGEIEKNLPIPPPHRGPKVRLSTLYPLDKMQVGDSFEVRKTATEDHLFYNRVTTRLRLEASRLRIGIRTVSTEHDPDIRPSIWTVRAVRVWRIL